MILRSIQRTRRTASIIPALALFSFAAGCAADDEEEKDAADVSGDDVESESDSDSGEGDDGDDGDDGDGDDSGTLVPALELGGVWSDNYGGWTYVDSTRWGASAVIEYDNDANWAVTQSPSDDAWNPDKYSLSVWTEPGSDGSWWTCTVAYGLDTLDAALTAEDTSDDTDPSTGGCGDFAWTQMTPRDPVEVVGYWEDNYGGTTDIAPDSWGSSSIHEYDNDGNWAVTQNPSDDEWNPSKYSYVVWTEPASDGSWWTCTVAYGLETLDAALSAEDTSDDTDPSTGGCGDFAWTEMTQGS